LILNYLRDHGVTPTPSNIRAAVEANAREGKSFGPDPVGGLRSDRPATEEEDQAAMRAAGKGGRRQSNTPVNTLTADANTPVNTLTADAGGNKTTSAQPASAASVAQSVLNQAGRFAVPEVPAPPEAPRAAAVPPVIPPEIPPNAASTMGAPASGWPAGTEAWAQPRGNVAAVPPVPNPMEVAMQRAVGSVPEVPPVPNPVAGVQPVPPEIAGRAAGGPATSVPPEVPGDMQFRRTGSGLQVQPNAMTRALPGAIAGAARGSRAGPLGALAGAAQGAAPDIIPYIMKNLHLN
jgi:hypothetical protein